MLARHSWNTPLSDALLTLFSAKKRAEIAPGVGKDADMIMVRRELGTFDFLRPDIVARVEQEHRALSKREREARRRAKQQMRKFIEDVVSQPPAHKQSEPPKPPSPSF
jgi:hypothetical protein